MVMLDKSKATYWIKKLELAEHPEGGFYRETYRKESKIHGRSLATNIFYLMPSERVSKFHRLQSDEIWYFHLGSPIQLYFFTPEGNYEEHMLGPDPEREQHLSKLIPARTIFGAMVTEPDSFGLVSCNMTPGFHFEDFELMSEIDLVEQFPQYKSIIKKLT